MIYTNLQLLTYRPIHVNGLFDFFLNTVRCVLSAPLSRLRNFVVNVKPISSKLFIIGLIIGLTDYTICDRLPLCPAGLSSGHWPVYCLRLGFRMMYNRLLPSALDTNATYSSATGTVLSELRTVYRTWCITSMTCITMYTRAGPQIVCVGHLNSLTTKGQNCVLIPIHAYMYIFWGTNCISWEVTNNYL